MQRKYNNVSTMSADLAKSVTCSLFKLRTAFPTQTRNYSAEEANALTSLWLEVFNGICPYVLNIAVTIYIKEERTGFFPSPGQIMGIVDSLLEEMPVGFIPLGIDADGNVFGKNND